MYKRIRDFTSSMEVASLGKDRGLPEQVSEYTVIGVIDDGQELNQAVSEIRELGVGPGDLTVVLKRQNPSEPEPFRREQGT